jgi:hypothetical protein
MVFIFFVICLSLGWIPVHINRDWLRVIFHVLYSIEVSLFRRWPIVGDLILRDFFWLILVILGIDWLRPLLEIFWFGSVVRVVVRIVCSGT